MRRSLTGTLTLRRRLVLAAGLAAGSAAVAPRVHAEPTGDPATQKYLCTEPDCAPYIYDPVQGNPSQGIPPGTPFEDLPDTWFCPSCGAPRSSFIPRG